MSLRGRIAIAGRTDTGRVRGHNEDAVGWDDRLGLLVLADGMGGLQAGEVASTMAVEVVKRRVADVVRDLPPGQFDEPSGYALASLAVGRAVLEANETIFRVASSQPQCAGMGTTLVVVLLHDNRFTVAHVGDSRLYRMREGAFEQLTVDHSLVQELVDQGFYTPEEARTAANRNIVTRALGIGEEVRYDLREEMALAGDLFLLCSDGLTDMLEDARIHAILSENQGSLEEAARRLVREANEHGGGDNISVLLARVERPFPAKAGWFRRLVNRFD